MANFDQVFNSLPSAKNIAVKVKQNQSTQDLIDSIKEAHQDNKKYANKIAHYFKGSNDYQTGKNIWQFLKNYVPYKIEPSDTQTSKTLPRILDDATKGIGSDCKHYSTFAGSILNSLNIPFIYRMAGYQSTTPQHIYCVIKNGAKDIPLDAVLPYYDYEKKNLKQIDMSLYNLSGVVDSDMGGFKDRFKKIKDGIKTVGLAVPRLAFLGLLELNVHKFATKLAELYKNKGDAGLKFWTDFGGDLDKFKKVIADGAKKKGFGDTDEKIMGVAIETLIASAIPIIMKVVKALKEAGIKTEDLTKIVADGKDAFKSITGQDADSTLFKKSQDSESTNTVLTSASVAPINDNDAKILTVAKEAQIIKNELKKGVSSGSKIKDFYNDHKKVILIGGGIVAAATIIYFLKKKK
tara:strand:- start:4322 stop:5542 length:1221 start_codon:yes stop_codon:yes gene_type:complete